MKILVFSRQGRSKSMHNTVHSWDPEKRASGTMDTQSIIMATGIFCASQMVEDFEN